MKLSDYVAKFLKSKGIKDIFMLTGYGAMYLNDSIFKEKLNFFATRNEATAPIMASAYSRTNKAKVGVACVTAGPGATNAIPGLAEAYVDSSPVIIISGQVIKKHTTYNAKLKGLRTFGTAEIDIVSKVKSLTKYATVVSNPNDIKYVMEKAYNVSVSGRPGPVWIDIPLDVQSKKIDIKKLKSYKEKKIKKKINKKKLDKIIKLIENSKKPLIVCGQGVKSSGTFNKIYKNLSLKKNIPILFSRAAQDLASHKNKNILGQFGIKGIKSSKEIMENSDLIISLGCRLAPQFTGHDFAAFKNGIIIAVDIEKDELLKKGTKLFMKLNYDLSDFIPALIKKINLKKKINFKEWALYCEKQKKIPIKLSLSKKNPMDLYYFMDQLGKFSDKNNILVTDAGSNYYAGGQVWKFEKGQKEITSITNAAMGLSIPLAIGSAVGDKNKMILAVTGDGSLELNIQELKTMSHYNFNIKLFVINNGGYVSMHNWADSFFDGRRVDDPNNTGEGTMNLKKISEAFDLDYFRIFDYKKVQSDLKHIISNNKPMFIEVITDNNQKIFDAYMDR